MLKKHYLSVLVVALSLLGIALQKQVEMPNQEIVVQFTDSSVDVGEIETIVSSIKIQLQGLGVNDITISKENFDKFVITYHTNSNVSSIKDKLSENGNLDFELNKKSNNHNESIPSREEAISYNLDVHEIQELKTTDWDFNGINTSTLDLKSDRFYNPSTNLFTVVFSFKNNNSATREAYKIKENNALAINKISHEIPEVRAGPQV